jgi:hypothetical protein
MRNLIRSPLAWAVSAEVAVVAALALVAWDGFASSARPPGAPGALQAPDPTGDPSPRLPELPAITHQTRFGPRPGLNLGAAFWHERLGQLNRDQVDFEQLEWRIVHAAEGAVSRYLETVVLPAIRHAESPDARGP